MVDLTERQREVLLAFLRSGSAPRAAEALGIELTTVRHHLHLIRGKLGAARTDELMEKAAEAGIVELVEL